MMSDSNSSAVQATEAVPTGVGPAPGGGSLAWNQPGFANLWGLATAKDSLKSWLQRKSFSSFILTRWFFAFYMAVSALNGYLVFNRTLTAGREVEIPSFPILTAIALLLVLGTTKERSQGTYFWAAWTFWIMVTLFGFVNAQSVNEDNYRLVIQVIIKSWIGIIGVPWMAFRVISPEKLPAYSKYLVLLVAVGSIISLMQSYNSDWFSYIRDNKTTLRGGGLWENPNPAGMTMMFAMLLLRLCTWRSKWVKWTVYLVILAGFIGTFSRGAFAGYIVAEMVYLLIVRDFKRFLLGGMLLMMFLATWITVGFMVENNTIKVENKDIRERMMTFSKLVSGKASEELETGRMYLWRAAMQDVLAEGNLLFGLGHLGMVRSKTLGLSPHNDYIQYFADSGLLGLLAFLTFLTSMVVIFLRCKDRQISATSVAMVVGLAVYGFSSNSLFLYPMIGPFFAIFVMWTYYSKEYPGAEKVNRLKVSLARSIAASAPPRPSPEATP